MEPQKADFVSNADEATQNDWRTSIRTYYTQNGFSDASDDEVIKTLKEVSSFAATPKEITLFLQGSSIESLVDARSTGRTPDRTFPFRSSQETQIENRRSVEQAAGCFSLLGVLITLGFLAYGIYLFFFSDTAKFMDSLK